jgi:hypothetical protein
MGTKSQLSASSLNDHRHGPDPIWSGAISGALREREREWNQAAEEAAVSGQLGDDDGGRRSPDPDGLPGFPPEWGRIVIPDDAAELDHEATKVRRELRREALLQRHGLRPGRRLHHLMLPLVLLTMAVLVATTSLFPQGRRGGGTPSSKATAVQTGAPLPDLALATSSGRSVALRGVHPAVVLVLRHCACRSLISGTAKAAGSQVRVLVVGASTAPTLPTLPAGSRVTAVRDDDDQLTEAVAAGQHRTKLADRTATALLVDQHGALTATVPTTVDPADFAERVPALAG